MVTMMRTETHTISSKGYTPLAVGDPDESDLDYPLAARTRASSLSILSPRTNKFSARFSSRKTRRSRLARDLCDGSVGSPKRECSPPPTMYQRTMCNSLEFECSNGSYRRTPSSLYQRSLWSSVELESNGDSSVQATPAMAGGRLERFVNSWEGVLEESDETDTEDSFRLRVSVHTDGGIVIVILLASYPALLPVFQCYTNRAGYEASHTPRSFILYDRLLMMFLIFVYA